MDDPDKAKEIYEKIIKKHPYFIEAYSCYWHYMKFKKNFKAMREIAEVALLKSSCTEISTNMWVETRCMMAKSYLCVNKVRKAIDILHEICYILPPFPLTGLKYIEQVLEEDNNEQFGALETENDEEAEADDIFDQAYCSYNNRKSIVLQVPDLNIHKDSPYEKDL